MNNAEQFAAIAALDLDPIKVKLMHEESGEGWTRAHADEVEFEYRRFLYLMKKFPNEQAAPLFDVDVFWHYHILDTMKYAADCDAVFGYFLHHFPYVGLRGKEDLEFHHSVGERMRELYEHTFGDLHPRKAAAETVSPSGGTAYSMPLGKKAGSRSAEQVSYCANVADSMPAANVAYSMPAAKVAYSMPAATASSMPTVSLDLSKTAATNFMRPTLTSAAV
jgi:hypothetical protein